MIIFIVSYDKKIQIFSVRSRLFVYLNEPFVLSKSYMNRSYKNIIKSGILFGARYQAINLLNRFLFSFYERINKWRFVDSPHVDLYVFIPLAKILFDPGVIMGHFKEPWSI